MAKTEADNRADQLNPNNDAFWQSRGWDDRPADWVDRVDDDDTEDRREEDKNKQSKR